MKKLLLMFTVVLLLGAGCTSTSPTTPTSGGGKEVAFNYQEEITLSVDETASFEDGLRVRLESINDSRCKAGVTCIWAGELGATFILQVGDGPSQELILGETTKPWAIALGYKFELVSINETSATIMVADKYAE